jgi:GMP synthase (glutamine-hydrolysing)
MISGSIIILDFGGQYAHLIASRIRRFGYQSLIFPADTPAEQLRGAAGIILSGGPQSVYDAGSPQADHKLFELQIPILGLCYGHQWLAQALGGKVTPAKVKEYGPTAITVSHPQDSLFEGLPQGLTVWMSHGDEVSQLPEGFVTVASSNDCINAAMMDATRHLYGIQCHIEVTHTEHGMDLLKNFVKLCNPTAWSMKGYSKMIGDEILKEVGDRKVFMLVSGGVDSTVAFTLLNQVLGVDRVQGLLIDTGLMRKNEIRLIEEAFKPLGITNLQIEDASDRFFAALKNVYDPEEKRKIIGNTFLEVQKEVSERMGLHDEDGWLADQNSESTDGWLADRSPRRGVGWMLGQGTIYPDTIETGGTKHADKIKTHHNRVPLIQEMMEKGLVIEPLKELYKDEVRELGYELGLPRELVDRHPFPGPGLGVRILCAEHASLLEESQAMSDERLVSSIILPIRSVGVQGDGRTYRHAISFFAEDPCCIASDYHALATSIPNSNKAINRVLQCLSHPSPFDAVFTPTYLTKDVADLLRDADAIVDEEMRKAGLYMNIWQFPVVLLPFGTSEGGRSIVLRPIESTDAMTANAFILPQNVLQSMTKRMMELDGIHAVFLDLTNKPPATIEWE